MDREQVMKKYSYEIQRLYAAKPRIGQDANQEDMFEIRKNPLDIPE